MSSFDVEVLPEAEAEAREAFLWYFERSPMAADAFRVELFDAIDGLSETAEDWPEDQDGFRHYHLRHFPYTVMYEVLGRNVTVFAIAHQRKRPGYWHDR
ncbi:type II toxin-antitoxin system RelE/ParE family toxin [Caenimonas soli]|uniref:type II toxin-antitoxin system RelE/ParE family toxin n=1 Tax=Caenimonas soli TaxID=2735555 RepID=UPI0015520001|nr:type II toxin-antitoxin system RelE/ParE family toxin [Caenimonas soli]NPC56026.1 type II toxin-antitoxin system RelE/ParE family toxin [Caenimonas soli]